jgi:hypothetical protein
MFPFSFVNYVILLLCICILNPPEDIPALTYWWGLCGHMIPRAMLAVAYAIGRASHAREVKGDDPDKKGYPGPPGWGIGVGLTTPHSKKFCYESRKKEKAGWI